MYSYGHSIVRLYTSDKTCNQIARYRTKTNRDSIVYLESRSSCEWTQERLEVACFVYARLCMLDSAACMLCNSDFAADPREKSLVCLSDVLLSQRLPPMLRYRTDLQVVEYGANLTLSRTMTMLSG